MARVLAVAFDVVETLFSLQNVRDGAAARGWPPVVDAWFANVLRDGFALTELGRFAQFREVAGPALARVLRVAGVTASESEVTEALSLFGSMDAYPDVRPAFEGLQAEGVTIACVTNGGASTTRALLERADVDKFVGEVISIDDVRAWKPRPDVYRAAAHRLGRVPSEVALVAVHAWDVAGAQRAGLVGAWCSRLEGTFSPMLGRPDVAAETLPAVADALVRADTGEG